MSSPYLQMITLDAREGSIKLGDKEVGIRFVDLNGDGKLGAGGFPWRTSPDLVQVPVPTPLEGAPEGQDSMYTNAVPLTRYLAFEGKYYLLGVRPDGAEVKVQPYVGEPAKLVISATDGRGRTAQVRDVYLMGENLYTTAPVTKPVLEVPPGEYQVRYALGDPKVKGSYVSFTAQKALTLKAGETTRLQGGGKLSLKVSASSFISAAKEAQLTVSVTPVNAAGHSYSGQNPDPKKVPAVVEVFDSHRHRIAKANASFG